MDKVDGWFSVKEIVATSAHLQDLEDKILAGNNPLVYGDFCSLPCLSRWAANAETLRQMEDRT